jgi:hypothetical protein
MTAPEREGSLGFALSQRLLTAAEVQQRFFLKADGAPSVSLKWILAHMPRVQLSKKVVRFRADDIELALASKVVAA